jgi:ABC-type transport system involved in multi-copper enzyme maturation permease subunit
MTTTAPASPEQRTASLPRGNRWLPTLRGTLLAANIELHRRRPTRKGWIVYGVSVGGVFALAVLIALVSGSGTTTVPLELNLLMVLGLGILIGTSLAATSVNGDSTEGVLAPLQMTRLTAGDIALGKLIASWAVAAIALITLLPILVYSYIKASWSPGEVGIMVGAIFFIVLATTAIGLAWSSIAARAIASVALAHLTVGALAIGTLVAFGVLTPLVSESVEVTNRYPDWSQATPEQQNDPNFTGEGLPCTEETYEEYITHTDRLAWLLLINPVVVLGETAPLIDVEALAAGEVSQGVFQMLHQTVSDARMGPPPVKGYDYCADPNAGVDEWEQRSMEAAGYPRNPWLGLGLYAALLVASLWFTVNRLRVPYRTLRGGTRVA